MIIYIDIWSHIIVNTNFDTPYFLVSKSLNTAYKNAVLLKLSSIKPIECFLKLREQRYTISVKVTLEYRKIDGFGLLINTGKRKRFFKRKFIIKNNLWVENNIIVSLKPEFVSFQFFIDNSFVHTKIQALPENYKRFLFNIS